MTDMEKLREEIAERLYWQYMGYDEKYHPLSLFEASRDMYKEMYARADQIISFSHQHMKIKLPENPHRQYESWSGYWRQTNEYTAFEQALQEVKKLNPEWGIE